MQRHYPPAAHDDGDILMMHSHMDMDTPLTQSPRAKSAYVPPHVSDMDMEDDNKPFAPKMACSASTGSLASSSSSSSVHMEPELSQSFGSTKSYDLMTPHKGYPTHTSRPADVLRSFAFHNNPPSSSSRANQSPGLQGTSQKMSAASLGSPKGGNLSERRMVNLSSLSVSREMTPLDGNVPLSSRPPPPGLAGRLKIDLPDKGLGASDGPVTPGGRVAQWARDGAAHGRLPLSPFEPPTPLLHPKEQALFGSPISQRPKIAHRHTTRPTPLAQNIPINSSHFGMSPLSKGLQSDHQYVSKSPVSEASSVTSDTSNSAASTCSTLLTPPYSPYTAQKSIISEEELGEYTLGKKRTDVSVRAPSPRSKAAKGKITPYPLPSREEGPSKTQNGLDSARQDSALKPSSPSILRDLVKPGMHSAPMMEKSVSEPVSPRTVSARHLMGRKLHPRFVQQYTICDELGSGGFGFVVSATRITDSRPVAVKFIWRDKVPNHGWVRDPEFGAIPMEAFVLRAIESPFVVKYIDLLADQDFFYLIQELHGSPWKAPESTKPDPKAKAPVMEKCSKSLHPAPQESTIASPTFAVFPPESNIPLPELPVLTHSPSSESAEDDESVVSDDSLNPPLAAAPMERRSSCDLFECIEQHSYFPEDRARWIFAQIVEAVYELGKKGIYHRDIKDENCVVDRDFNVKLIDFGSAVVTDPRRPAPYFNRFFGTMTFAPSEILQGKQYRAPHAEIWSLGVLLSILLTGECPFSDPKDAVQGRLSKSTDKWPPEALDLLLSCLVVNPDHRATITQVRDHPWVSRAWLQRTGARPDGSHPLSS